MLRDLPFRLQLPENHLPLQSLSAVQTFAQWVSFPYSSDIYVRQNQTR